MQLFINCLGSLHSPCLTRATLEQTTPNHETPPTATSTQGGSSPPKRIPSDESIINSRSSVVYPESINNHTKMLLPDKLKLVRCNSDADILLSGETKEPHTEEAFDDQPVVKRVKLRKRSQSTDDLILDTPTYSDPDDLALASQKVEDILSDRKSSTSKSKPFSTVWSHLRRKDSKEKKKHYKRRRGQSTSDESQTPPVELVNVRPLSGSITPVDASSLDSSPATSRKETLPKTSERFSLILWQ